MILSFRTDMPGQTVQTQIRLISVYTVCHSVCIVWTLYSMVKPHGSNFRVITTNFWGVRIFRKFTVYQICLYFLQFGMHRQEDYGAHKAKKGSIFMLLTIKPTHKIMALFVRRKLTLQTRMHSHWVGLVISFLVRPFVYLHTLRTAKALAAQSRLSLRCPQCDKYHNLISLLSYDLHTRISTLVIHECFHTCANMK